MQVTREDIDPQKQLRTLYRQLLEREDQYHEFKQLLALYPTDVADGGESTEARRIRDQLNASVREWIGGRFDGLSVMQMLLWRSIIVEERFNIALAPWKEANAY